MDHAVRCLREGRSDGSDAALVCVSSNCEAPHGAVLTAEVCQSFYSALGTGRCQASALHCYDCEGTTARKWPQAGTGQPTCLATDPFTWARPAAEDTATATLPEGRGLSCAAIEDDISSKLGHSQPGLQSGQAIAIIGLSTLALVEGQAKVLAMVQRLLWDPGVSCLLLSIQQELVPSTFLAALQPLARCVLRIKALHAAVAQSVETVTGFWPAGLLHAASPRRSGRVWTQTELLRQHADGKMQAVPVPAGLDLAAASLAAAKIGSTVGGSGGPAATTSAKTEPSAGPGGMRLGMTDQERSARDRVVLPHEMRALQAVQDSTARQGMPATLGYIDYVRDSDTDPDSDEDPDDDLDF